LNGEDGKAATTEGTSVAKDITAKATDTWGNALLNGTGYTYTAKDSVNQTALKNAKTGDTISLIVNQNDSAQTKISFYALSSDQTQAATKLTAYASGTATATTVSFPTVSAGFSGAAGVAFTASDVQDYLTTNALTTLYTPSYKNAAGKQVYTKYVFKNSVAGSYSTTTNAQAFYTGTEVEGASPVDKVTTPSVDYVG